MALALPLYKALGDGGDAERLAAVVREQEPDRVVMGLPINMDDTEGPAAETVRAFGEELGGHLGIAIEYRDERLTSEEAERKLRDLPMTREKKKEHVNTVAAQIILEAFLKEIA